MEKLVRSLTLILSLAVLGVAGGICNLYAAGEGHGHRFGADMMIVSSLGLTQDEQTALMSALSTYGPALKTAMQTFHAARKQLNTDLQATSPDGSQLAADAQALANAKQQLKTARTQLNDSLKTALTPEHLQQLQASLTAQFQSRLDSKTGRLLFGYALSLKRQSQQTVSTGTAEAQ
jgi:Spy/CpxP family protein refolding chaperone